MNELSVRRYRKNITALEAAMEAELDTFDPKCFNKHHFCAGVYVREFFLPKGFVVTGKIHRYPCINILLAGKIRIAQSDGLETVMEAPQIYQSQAGEKKALFALEDTIFVTTHALPPHLIDATEDDMDAMEEHFTVPSFEALDQERREALEGS